MEKRRVIPNRKTSLEVHDPVRAQPEEHRGEREGETVGHASGP